MAGTCNVKVIVMIYPCAMLENMSLLHGNFAKKMKDFSTAWSPSPGGKEVDETIQKTGLI